MEADLELQETALAAVVAFAALSFALVLVVVIPGRDRRRAVIMGDHYDTAYMEDHYGYMHGGKGPRLAAAGADDNHSATATLMVLPLGDRLLSSALYRNLLR